MAELRLWLCADALARDWQHAAAGAVPVMELFFISLVVSGVNAAASRRRTGKG
jgi:hypothetical protein